MANRLMAMVTELEREPSSTAAVQCREEPLPDPHDEPEALQQITVGKNDALLQALRRVHGPHGRPDIFELLIRSSC